MTKNKQLARLFYIEQLKIRENEAIDTQAKINALYRLLQLIFLEVTKDKKLHFTTLFSRIAYSCHANKINKSLQYHIHRFRKAALSSLTQARSKEELQILFETGFTVVAECISGLYKTPVSPQIERHLSKEVFDWKIPKNIQAFEAKMRVVALEIDRKHEQLVVQKEEMAGLELRMQYNIAHRNENFNPTIEAIREVFQFPVTLNLIDVEIDAEGILHPRAIVVEPDYLVDVTAIAECFKPTGTEAWLHLLKKYLPFQSSKYLMLGNIANFFLDELMTDTNIPFRETFAKVFGLKPLTFCVFEDRIVREIWQTSQKHFLNLKKMVKEELPNQHISPDDCFLEPSFFSETFGLQGRLDVFHQASDDSDKADIIELKSGSVYRPNVYGICTNHFTQTLLYDLIIHSVFEGKAKPKNFILYSGAFENNLRFAPVIKAQQYEALQIRNQLVAFERLLEKDDYSIFSKLQIDRYPYLTGFLKKDLLHFESVYNGMNSLEKDYFHAFSGFIAREHQLAKTGVQGQDTINGLASIWLDPLQEKESNYVIISNLEILDNQAGADEPLITFKRTESTNPLANFRKGDIGVLYPVNSHSQPALSNQVFKCSILEITNEQVVVRLRSRQFNNSIFEKYPLWNLEHDVLDSGFVNMYKGLFEFAQSPKEKRDLLLTLKPPKKGITKEVEVSDELTEEQKNIFNKILHSEDYFLLWGPPGTGKTSKMLKQLVAHLLTNTSEDILLLAYTNRAVDEICDAVESISQKASDSYLRIGSRYSTSPRFQEKLLSIQTQKVQSRKELKGIINRHRIIVSTVASLGGQMELFQLKTFKRVIIDEASQILEPALVGLLPRFKQFILIGDHQQLPAVVVQSNENSKTEKSSLHKIGLNNLRNSLFERMYKRCMENGWHWAYAQLSRQGRMHEDIMQFVSKEFYEDKLRILPETIAHHKNQLAPLSYQLPEKPPELQKHIARRRVVFLPSPVDSTSVTQKTNIHEATLICKLVKHFLQLYELNGKEFDQNSLGIITPYRAQIAQIRQVLSKEKVSPEKLTIDTVERYQGGARDIILISLCTNSIRQLENLISLSEEGVDRKLNVALTRAKEHLMIVGNPELLAKIPLYAKLIEAFGGQG